MVYLFSSISLNVLPIKNLFKIGYETSVCSSPAEVTEIEPCHKQSQVLPSSNALILLIHTSDIPGDQGVTVSGTHGAGVSTPPAAAVAAITAGLVSEEQVPKDIILTSGI